MADVTWLRWEPWLGDGLSNGKILLLCFESGKIKDDGQKVLFVEGCGSGKGDERRRPSDPFDVFDFGSVNFLQIE